MPPALPTAEQHAMAALPAAVRDVVACARRVCLCRHEGFVGPLGVDPSEHRDIGTWALAKLAEAVAELDRPVTPASPAPALPELPLAPGPLEVIVDYRQHPDVSTDQAVFLAEPPQGYRYELPTDVLHGRRVRGTRRDRWDNLILQLD